MSDALVCEGVVKRYGEMVAVDGVSLRVKRGEVFGLIGPNGAGKTSLVECLAGLRPRDGGSVELLGLDPEVRTKEVRQRTCIQLQTSALPSRIKVREAVELFASFYGRRADTGLLLERLGLADKADSYVEKLSGGQRQRVFIALALVNEPELVFLDELTTGLDPRARMAIWDVIEEIRDQGTTVILTTHFMEEAEKLCDRVGIIDQGRIVALDTVPALIGTLGAPSRLTFRVDGQVPLADIRGVAGVSRVGTQGSRITVDGTGERYQQEVLRLLAEGILGFGANPAGGLAGVLLMSALGVLAFLTLGYALTALVPTLGVAQLVGNVLVYPLIILSGATVPLALLPEAVQSIAALSPLTQLVQGLQAWWQATPAWTPTLTMLAVIALAGLIAGRFFRWE